MRLRKRAKVTCKKIIERRLACCIGRCKLCPGGKRGKQCEYKKPNRDRERQVRTGWRRPAGGAVARTEEFWLNPDHFNRNLPVTVVLAHKGVPPFAIHSS